MSEEPRDGRDDKFEEFFEGLDREDIDDEELWAELSAGEAPASGEGDLFSQLANESPTEHAEAAVETDDEEAVVPKNRYCQGCQYLSKPPDIACGHPGTEIVEVIDSERFQVRNCPVVRERRETADVLEEE
ncbi:hypothetical protein BRD07_02780 [Halobacteriales archaeon QS_9_68_42]|nr:MAG: hypothetical protein BRC84_02035 [Halobacteriales archaeon QS_1_68_44]PSQ42877.1 MAG: hypothetical protein BRD07_02780 [Halobacteriales archaeon QS_9_68_42]